MWLLDLETKSSTEISRGHDQYFQDPDADILCMVYGDENWESPNTWWPGCGWDPDDLYEWVNSGGLVGASNAAFDRSGWEYLGVELYDWPPMRLDQWYCTQLQSRIAGLPSSLSNMADALQLKMRKSRRGQELIRKMCIPPFEFTAELLNEMVTYCGQDWYVMRDGMQATPLVPQHLHADYVVGELVNERGIKIDREMAVAASRYAAQERSEIAGYLYEITEGAVSKPTEHQRFKKWLFAGLWENECGDAIGLMKRYKKGALKWSSDKIVRGNLLTNPFELGIPDDIVTGLQLMDDAGGSATSKYTKMDELADPSDDRVRGIIRTAGAPATLRYSSLSLQVHNMIRDTFPIDEVEWYRRQMVKGETLTDPVTDEPVRVMATLGKLLRSTIIPEPGNVFIVGDWKAFESRITAWVAREDRKLDVFLSGECPYCYAASGIYGRPITQEDDPTERQVGKVTDLASGFLGGPGALAAMASSYKIYIPSDEREAIVKAWRKRHPKTVAFGNLLMTTAIRAMRSAGQWHQADRVAYLFDGSALYCRLPDGITLLRYPETRLASVEAPWSTPEKPKYVLEITALKAAYKKAADADEWPRHGLWRGLLLENIVQAIETILLRRIVAEFQDVCIFHVHDEVVLEVSIALAEQVRARLAQEMVRILPWCEDLPLVVDGPHILTRYGKAA